MAAFAGIDKALPAGGDSLGTADDEIRALKLFLQEVLGLPNATTITNEAMNIASDGGIVFNDTSADIDYRFEGANNANLLVLDGGQDAISFGGANVDGAAAIFNNLQQRTHITSVGSQIHVPAQITDFDNPNGTIAIGSAMFLGIPTWTNANATLTMTNGATLYIQGVPVDSTNVTLSTAGYAIWVDAGDSRFDGAIEVQGAAPATPVAKTLYEDSIVKGWVDFDSAVDIKDDINVTTITDTGTGDWTVNWVTDFATANYGIALSIENGTTRAHPTTGTPVAGSVQILVLDSSGNALDPNGIRVIAIGNN